MNYNYRRYHAIQRGYKGDEYLKKMLFKGWRNVGLKDNFEDVFLIYCGGFPYIPANKFLANSKSV